MFTQLIQPNRWWDTRWARLGAGFAALLILIILMAVSTFRETFDIFHRITDVNARYNRVGEALAKIRSDIYLAGIVKRDFLLDPESANADLYRLQFSEIQSSTRQHLATLEALLDPEQRPHLEQLRQELQLYLRPFDRAVDWRLPRSSSLRGQLLRLQLGQRNAVLDIAYDIESLNSSNFERQQTRIRDAEQRFRTLLLWITGATLAVGALVAAFSMVHMMRLERKSVQAEKELRQLSNQIVKVQEQERKSISRELHDEVGQLLTGLRMELAGLDGPFARSNPIFHQRLTEAKSVAEQTLRCVRNMAMLLRPSMLDDIGLSPALDWQVTEFSRHSGIRVQLQLKGDIDSLPDEYRTCLYRVTQEALTNAARHGKPQHIRVQIERVADAVVAEIVDDGAGFDRRRLHRPGLGLLGMHERALELGGTLDVSSAPGKGTRISMRLPVKTEKNEYTGITG